MATVQVADERAFSFLRVNERQRKPRTEGITEIRGPYYTPMTYKGQETMKISRIETEVRGTWLT